VRTINLSWYQFFDIAINLFLLHQGQHEERQPADDERTRDYRQAGIVDAYR